MSDIALSHAISPAISRGREGRDALTPAWHAWREIGLALLFGIAALLVGLLVFGAISEAGTIFRDPWGWSSSSVRIYGSVVGESATLAALLWMVIARAGYLGRGDPTAGLAAGPIRHPQLVLRLCVIQIACVLWPLAKAYLFGDFRSWFHSDCSTGMAAALIVLMHAGPLALALKLFNITVLTAVCEELLFRGWLWTALRRHWSLLATMLSTSGVWWLLHGALGVDRLAVLLPLAITLTLVRHYDGGIRGTIAIHAANNSAVMLIVMASMLAG